MKTYITVEELYFKWRSEEVVEIPILADVVYYLKRNPGIKGKELAKKLEVNRSYLSHSIELLTGSNLATLLLDWRLLHAKYLLSETNDSYDTIAKRCGFSGNHTLSRFLDRHIGCTAFEYRLGYSNGHRGAV